MNLTSKKVAFCALLIAALASAPYARHLWFESFVVDRTFSTSFIWFDPGQAISWLFELLFFFFFGLLVARLFRANAPFSWALVLGAICAAEHLLYTTNFIYEASPSVYVWAYGTYAMPLIGVLFGAFVALTHRSSGSPSATAERIR